MTSRPVVSVYKSDATKEVSGSIPMPGVFSAPIRNDLVHFVHSELSKNRRQGHAVFFKAGAEHSAESWGTGRAVARIPRIGGSGTSRSGQATFGNMCRKARMFAPLKIWRKWHRRVNITQRRHAVASALAASAVAPLVMARGHQISNIPELPLVIDSLNVPNCKTLIKALENFGVGDDLNKVRGQKQMRAGTGKYRNSKYILRKGPLIIYGNDSTDVKRMAKNLPGVDVCHVSRLNIIQLAPGGHLGRLVVFTKCGFNQLNNQFGSHFKNSVNKVGYSMNRPLMACADLSRIINSDKIQESLRAIRTTLQTARSTKKNPLTNVAMMNKMNPFAAQQRALVAKGNADRKAVRAATLKAKRSKAGKASKAKRNATYSDLQKNLGDAYKAAEKIIDDDEKAGNYQPGDTDEEEED